MVGAEGAVLASAFEVPGKRAKRLWGLEMEPGEEEEQGEEVTVWAAVLSEVCKKISRWKTE